MDCDAQATGQAIRAVCTADDDTCGHVYKGGVLNTLVRLPDDVSAGRPDGRPVDQPIL